MRNFAFVTVLLSAGFSFGATAFGATEGEISARWVERFPFVDAYVNGQGPFRLLLDTGATLTSLNPKAAERAQLRYDRRVSEISVGGEDILQVASGTPIRVGTVETSGEVSVSRMDGLRRLDPKADGILGQSFLGQIAYLIDFRHHRILFGDAASREGSDLPVARAGDPNYGRPVVLAHINGHSEPYRFVLDTGASDVFLRCALLCPQLMDPLPAAAAGSGYLSAARVGTLRVLQIAEMRLWNLRAAVLEQESRPSEHGLLAAKLFSAIYVDAGGRVIRLKP